MRSNSKVLDLPVTVKPIVDIDECHERIERANSMNFSGRTQSDNIASIVADIRKERHQ